MQKYEVEEDFINKKLDEKLSAEEGLERISMVHIFVEMCQELGLETSRYRLG